MSVMSLFGLGGDQGSYFKASNANPALDSLNKYNKAVTNGATDKAIKGYGSGEYSLADALKTGSMEGEDELALRNSLATDPYSGSKYATEQVQNNGILGSLFGQNGELNKSVATEQKLQDQGYKLQPQDLEAYGQASGNIARQFGQSENTLAQSLAGRGLGTGNSGIAGAQFSGLNGNKNEMLAQAQTAIADQRMQNTMKRIGQQQQFISQLGTQANNAIQDQYGRQVQGANFSRGGLENNANLQTAQNRAANEANQAETENQQSREGKTLFGAIGQGLYGGTANLASQAPGAAVSGGSSLFSGGGTPAASGAAGGASSVPQTYQSKNFGTIGK